MNFLELVQRLHQEAGLQGTAPATVIAQTGMNKRLVDWCIEADKEIQRLHETWLFRQAEFTFPTINGVQNYTRAGVGLTDLASWKYDPDPNNLSGIRLYSAFADEQDLIYIPWEDFRTTYKYGSFRTQTTRPTIFSIKPDMSMDLWAIPDAVYTVNGEYVKQVVAMAANVSVSVIPADYHMAIVWKGLMLYGAFEGAPEAYAHGEKQYNEIKMQLELNQLPRPGWGPSLA
jgi:hypothetical protein